MPSDSASPNLLDALGRPLRSVRVSVTDRCNLRCEYCMPEADYRWIPQPDVLTFEEIDRLAGVYVRLGVRKLRLTGGEPLLRRDLPALVALLARRKGLHDLALTTNGVLLSEQAELLAGAGLRRATVSVDTLRPERFAALTRSAVLPRVLEGIRSAARLGMRLKLNAVIVRGFNDDELGDLIEFARGVAAELRLIEYMDVGGATRWSAAQVVSRDEMLARLERRYGRAEPMPSDDRSAPAARLRLGDGTIVGVIASTTSPFCGACDRGRLTADGQWLLCLYAHRGLDLRAALRGGASDEEIAACLTQSWATRVDRGAEQRLAQPDRGVFIPLTELRRDIHAEMHTRGG